MTSVVQVLLGHQGGWDEMLMVLGPILLFWLILRSARRRAERAVEVPSADRPSSEPATGAPAVDEHPPT
jgi:hypothetical protein